MPFFAVVSSFLYCHLQRTFPGFQKLITRNDERYPLDYMEEESLEEFLIGFPTVTREQAERVIEMAAEKFSSGIAE